METAWQSFFWTMVSPEARLCMVVAPKDVVPSCILTRCCFFHLQKSHTQLSNRQNLSHQRARAKKLLHLLLVPPALQLQGLHQALPCCT
jgi:hypothetical protein